MKRQLLILTAAIAVLISTGPAVTTSSAQTGDATDLSAAIERNGELLIQAGELVHQTGSLRARASFGKARKLHEYSLSLRNSGAPALQVFRVTREARRAILQTISIAKQEAKMIERARAAMERAAARLEQARGLLDEKGRPDDSAPRRLVEQAHEQLQKARHHMQEHMFETALQLANASAELSMRAINMLTRDTISAADVQAAIERTDQALERAADAAEGNETALGVLAEARDLQDRARRDARDGQLRRALERTRRARGMVVRVARRLGNAGSVDEQSVERALDVTDGVLERLREAAAGNEDLTAGLKEAEVLQDRARERYRKGDPAAAMRLTRQARRVAGAQLESVEVDVDRDTVADALKRTDDVIATLRAALEQTPDQRARELLERAGDRQREARSDLEADRLRKSLVTTRVARRLATQGLEIINNNRP